MKRLGHKMNWMPLLGLFGQQHTCSLGRIGSGPEMKQKQGRVCGGVYTCRHGKEWWHTGTDATPWYYLLGFGFVFVTENHVKTQTHLGWVWTVWVLLHMGRTWTPNNECFPWTKTENARTPFMFLYAAPCAVLICYDSLYRKSSCQTCG